MRFGVLGPLAVWTSDGRPVQVPELKVRALLACLLTHRDGPVSADRLIDDLWGDRPPRRPAAALQNKVWQLRRALEGAEPGGRDLVVSLPAGYRLHTGAPSPNDTNGTDGTDSTRCPDPVHTVDADQFDALTDSARATGDPAARAALWAEALALWRGPAYGDFADEEFARGAAARLTEQRLTALEEQAETRLVLGEHTLVADELGDLTERHPLRERLRCAHVRALYLAGRQSAALASYTELRERLADELGVDPSPPLVALHRAILSQDPSLTAAPAPVTTAARPPARLPGGLTELVGRDAAVRELDGVLAAHRLVTLTGPGGVGKTRLAWAAAARSAAADPGGVRLADLAALPPAHGADDTRALELVADVAGVRDDVATPGDRPRSLADRVAHALGDRPSLLVLDNCEHVVEPVADLVGRLLTALPGLRVLATSQLPLGVPGERLQEVPPLAEPDAVALFAARAAAVAPFVLDATTRGEVAAICRRLDGIPLAVEMAATRVRVLGLSELAARLDDRFRLLASGVRGAPPRQRTLRAVIDWSWELLGERERTVLTRLAVHADGCDLSAAEAVCPAGGVDRHDVLDLLTRLVDGSLVVVRDGTDGPRYRLLESVAAYCLDRLRTAGELAGLQERHRDHYTRLAERAAPHLRGHGQREWLRRLDTENANLRAALDGAVRDGDGERALRLVNALGWYWYLRGRHREAERALTRALAVPYPVDGRPDGRPGERAARIARASALLGGVRLALGGTADPAAEYRTALARYEDVDDPAGLAWSRWFLGLNLYGITDATPSEDLITGALDEFRAMGDRWGTAAALASQACQAKLRGRFGVLRGLGEQSLRVFTELGDAWGQVQSLVPLQTLAEVTGDYASAGRLHREALRLAEDLGLWREVSFQLSGLGRIALLTADLPLAAEYHRRARRLAVEQSDGMSEQYAETGLAMGARRAGDLDAAEAGFDRVLVLHRRLGYEPARPPLILAELGFVAEARGDRDTALRLHAEGLATARGSGDPRALALGLEGLAAARSLFGDAEEAARLLGAADAARCAVGAPLPDGERGDVDRVSARVRQVLGADGFAAAFARGRSLDPDSAVGDLVPLP
ncbi:BTAD domain-containing putative transcriptional regulator [Streptomyces sp. NPDC005955]|uniref:BTAD domain-containing putative transcriptional regulator n=1 Tax=Streptomyces sp. NPDC005955 TaxID=3364738 RepID=UPI00368BD78D